MLIFNDFVLEMIIVEIKTIWTVGVTKHFGAAVPKSATLHNFTLHSDRMIIDA
jgi:hypothetical protein